MLRQQENIDTVTQSKDMHENNKAKIMLIKEHKGNVICNRDQVSTP